MKQRYGFRKGIIGLGAISLLLLLLAGCGGASGDKETNNAATPSASAEPVPIKIQLSWVPQAEFAGFYVAKEKGYYKEEGLDVEVVAGGPDIVPEQQVANGTAQFGVNLVGSLLSHIEQGVPLVQIGQIFQDSSMVLVSKKDSGIDSPEKFAGKKVGNWMGGNEYEVLALFSKYGFDPLKDVKFTKQGFTMDQFMNGDLDVATAMIYNEYHVLLENGYKPEDLNVFNLDQLGVGMLHDNLFVNKEWLASNEETAVKFVRATLKGWKDAIADQEGAVDIVMKAVEEGSSTRDHQLTMMKEVAKLVQPEGLSADKIGFTNQERFQLTADIALKFGVIKNQADVPAAFTNDIVEKALKGM
ncbi:ABC transporter substrate-binding protein [Paenibacillus beijingensis]|uniref:Thiamine pyrimidine synthase n=1 Tax=Paenibacillus beijingensis TaxID=1126833 RepID=A0A0D5NI93_9BACL|nr:ABC transporter substrate-binding protein [Paenibacillus beijingensis]AJY74835.1 myristoyl transferase [Paenibacillus beijingensis]